MERIGRQLLLKTLSKNPLEGKIAEKKEEGRKKATLKRAYMRQPEEVKHPII